MHSLAGIFVFAIALGSIFAIDALLTATYSRWRRA